MKKSIYKKGGASAVPSTKQPLGLMTIIIPFLCMMSTFSLFMKDLKWLATVAWFIGGALLYMLSMLDSLSRLPFDENFGMNPLGMPKLFNQSFTLYNLFFTIGLLFPVGDVPIDDSFNYAALALAVSFFLLDIILRTQLLNSIGEGGYEGGSKISLSLFVIMIYGYGMAILGGLLADSTQRPKSYYLNNQDPSQLQCSPCENRDLLNDILDKVDTANDEGG